jgi:mRNA interferase MazF
MDVVKRVARFDVHRVALDPTRGSEIRKTRPCVIVSPDEANEWLRTVVVAPMTSTTKGYPSRVPVTFGDRSGEIALDQIRAVDKSRLVRRLGSLDERTARSIASTLVEMFAY